MTELAERILKKLEAVSEIGSIELAKEFDVDHQKVVGAIKSLQSLPTDVVSSEQISITQYQLTPEGEEVVSEGSHEARLYQAVPQTEGILHKEIMASVPNAKIGFSKAMSAGWIQLDKKNSKGPLVTRKVSSIEDRVQACLVRVRDMRLEEVSEAERGDMKKRKLMQEVLVKAYVVRQGKEFTTTISKPETDLTPEMIASSCWSSKSFKPYNFSSLGCPITSGHLHPLMKVRSEFRQIFLEMGFTEMPTNQFVESSFWNFDALFQPQQHPARDEHDTFFISVPQNAKLTDFPREYLERVKEVHSVGGYGSQGYKYDWTIEDAQKNILRTHTTAVSSKMLYQLAQTGFHPCKYFSIDRVFRNESLDATHLAEFHQIEGLVVDYDLTLGDLMGMLKQFFTKLGIEKLKFKPAYNPYTEPSMEVFSYHKGLGKWVEIGNSGIFRPEMLRPMGLSEDVSVIAWGLSLERPTMIKYGVNNIRDLVGHKVNLQMVYDNPICRLDK